MSSLVAAMFVSTRPRRNVVDDDRWCFLMKDTSSVYNRVFFGLRVTKHTPSGLQFRACITATKSSAAGWPSIYRAQVFRVLALALGKSCIRLQRFHGPVSIGNRVSDNRNS